MKIYNKKDKLNQLLSKGAAMSEKVDKFQNQINEIQLQIFFQLNSFLERKNYPIENSKDVHEHLTRFKEESLTLKGLAREFDQVIDSKTNALANEVSKVVEEGLVNYITGQFIPSAQSIILESRDEFEGADKNEPLEFIELTNLQQSITDSKGKGQGPFRN